MTLGIIQVRGDCDVNQGIKVEVVRIVEARAGRIC